MILEISLFLGGIMLGAAPFISRRSTDSERIDELENTIKDKDEKISYMYSKFENQEDEIKLIKLLKHINFQFEYLSRIQQETGRAPTRAEYIKNSRDFYFLEAEKQYRNRVALIEERFREIENFLEEPLEEPYNTP